MKLSQVDPNIILESLMPMQEESGISVEDLARVLAAHELNEWSSRLTSVELTMHTEYLAEMAQKGSKTPTPAVPASSAAAAGAIFLICPLFQKTFIERVGSNDALMQSFRQFQQAKRHNPQNYTGVRTLPSGAALTSQYPGLCYGTLT